jgi:hypothetical protein
MKALTPFQKKLARSNFLGSLFVLLPAALCAIYFCGGALYIGHYHITPDKNPWLVVGWIIGVVILMVLTLLIFPLSIEDWQDRLPEKVIKRVDDLGISAHPIANQLVQQTLEQDDGSALYQWLETYEQVQKLQKQIAALEKKELGL